MSLGCSGTGPSLWIDTRKSPSLGRSFSGCADAGLAIARAATSRLTTDTTVRKLRLVSPLLHADIGSALDFRDYLFKLKLSTARCAANPKTSVRLTEFGGVRLARAPAHLRKRSGAPMGRSICRKSLALP